MTRTKQRFFEVLFGHVQCGTSPSPGRPRRAFWPPWQMKKPLRLLRSCCLAFRSIYSVLDSGGRCLDRIKDACRTSLLVQKVRKWIGGGLNATWRVIHSETEEHQPTFVRSTPKHVAQVIQGPSENERWTSTGLEMVTLFCLRGHLILLMEEIPQQPPGMYQKNQP